MSKITNDGLTRSGTGCFMYSCTVPKWQQLASKGKRSDSDLISGRRRPTKLISVAAAWAADAGKPSRVHARPHPDGPRAVPSHQSFH